MRQLRLMFSVLTLLLALQHSARCQWRFPFTGARSAGMADSYVAAADDPSAVIWNPAMLASLERPDILQARASEGQVTDSFTAVALPLGHLGTLGCAYNHSDIGYLPRMSLEQRTWAVGFGHSFGTLSLGISYADQRWESSSTPIDLARYKDTIIGILYQPDANARYGVRIRNTTCDPGDGFGPFFSDDTYGYPAAFDLGLSRRFDTAAFGKLTVALSIRDVGRPYSCTSFGVEACPDKRVAIRLGVSDESSTAGFGYKIGSGSIDVAWRQDRYDDVFVASGAVGF